MAAQAPGRRSPMDWDPELGTKPVSMFDPTRPRPQEKVEVVVSQPPPKVEKKPEGEDILYSKVLPPSSYKTLTRGQGKRKTRKGKKSHKKTQKRRARK
jgi:hypothetical protein